MSGISPSYALLFFLLGDIMQTYSNVIIKIGAFQY